MKLFLRILALIPFSFGFYIVVRGFLGFSMPEAIVGDILFLGLVCFALDFTPLDGVLDRPIDWTKWGR